MNELLTFRQARGYLTSRRASPPDAHMCKQLAQGCTWQRGGRDSNPRPVDRKSGSGGTGRIMQYLKKKSQSYHSACKIFPLWGAYFEFRRFIPCWKSPRFARASERFSWPLTSSGMCTGPVPEDDFSTGQFKNCPARR